MRRQPVYCGLLICCLAFVASAEEVVRSEHGFAIRPPDDDWILQDGTEDRAFTLTAMPPGSVGQISVQVKVYPAAGIAGEEGMRQSVLDSVEGQEKYSRLEETEFWAAGKMRPGLIAETASSGVVYRVRQAYVLRDDKGYVLQVLAPVPLFDDHAEAFDHWFRSFRLTELSAEAQEQNRLKQIAGRCGTEFPWAESWEEAAERARKGQRLVLAYGRFQPGFSISDSMLSGPFMDAAIVDLIRERFSAVRLKKGMSSPLDRRDVYGLSGSSFGVSLLVCRPDGEVLREGFVEDPSVVFELLLDALSLAPEATGPRLPDPEKKPINVAWRHLRRGELDAAWAIFQDIRSPAARRGCAAVLELRRDGEAALRELRTARSVGDAAEHADTSVDAGRILLRLGRHAAAETTLEEFLNANPTHARASEALFLQGEARRKLNGNAAAAKAWRQVVDRDPENRWAWKAAAALTSTIFAIGGGERQSWPADELLSAVRPVPYQPVEVQEAVRAEQDAIRFLLRKQRLDGSWISPAEVEQGGDFDFPDPFVNAITAICIRGLVPHRKDPAVLDSIERGLTFLAAEREQARKKPPPVFFMDYTVWSHTYEILALSDCLDADLVQRDATVADLEYLVGVLRDKQQRNGGWSYYVSSDLEGTPVHQSISFVTATVTAAILRARESGAAVPTEMTAAALTSLEQMRNPNRTFEYFLFDDAGGGKRNTARPGAAGRGPICELALLRGGRGSLDALRESIEIWVGNADELAREAGKALMHSGDDGQGCHYILFDYATIAEAVAALPEAERPRLQTLLLMRILATRTADGAYLDAPFLGRPYGAGMALFAFHCLAPLPFREV